MDFSFSTTPPNSEMIFCPTVDYDEFNCKESAQCNGDFYDGLPIGGITEYDSLVINPCSEYECDQFNLMFNVTQNCMMLPPLVESMETTNFDNSSACEEIWINSNNSWVHMLEQDKKFYNHECDVESGNFDSEEAESFDPHLFIRNLPDPSDTEPNLWPILLPKGTSNVKQVTLVLDLDETLVHSTLEPCNGADFNFQVHFDMKEHTVYVRERPFLHTFLERVADMFEIIVFTASQKMYAEQLLDILDPDRKFISRRAYRDMCIFSDGSYTKDLTVLGVDLAKIAIIDNSPQVFRLQVDNGIPIQSWFDDPSDRALLSLLPFLETLVDVDDVRPIIAEKFLVKV